jgi:HEAT repeat protein
LSDKRIRIRRFISMAFVILTPAVVLCGCLVGHAGKRTGEVETDREIARCVSRLGQADSADARTAADELVGMGPKAVRALTSAARSGDPELESAAIKCLARIGDASCADEIAEAMRTSPNMDTRLQAVRALRTLKLPQLTGYIAYQMEVERVAVVRREIALALGEAGDRRCMEVLAEHLSDPATLVREAVIDGLARTPERDIAISLLQHWRWLPQSGCTAEREKLVAIFAKWKTLDAVPTLAESLPEPLPSSLRAQMARALGEIGDLRAVRPLIGVLEDYSADVVTASHEALSEITGAEISLPGELNVGTQKELARQWREWAARNLK